MTDDSDSKEWVTIKIPETVRDRARDDPRTYGELMQAGLDALRLERQTIQRFHDARQDTKNDHVPEMDADTFLNSLLDTEEKVKEHGYGDTAPESDVPVPADVREQLDRIESAAETAEERTGRIEGALEDAGIGR